MRERENKLEKLRDRMIERFREGEKDKSWRERERDVELEETAREKERKPEMTERGRK